MYNSNRQPPPLPGPLERQLHGQFYASGKPLYALMDAARDPKILKLLKQHGSQNHSTCLFDGAMAQSLADYGPYLVVLKPDDWLQQELILQGWGQSWGIYFTSLARPEVILTHLQRFIMVKLPDGDRAYFRFHDPRVLTGFLHSSNPKELAQFKAEIIDELFIETHKGARLLRFEGVARDRSGSPFIQHVIELEGYELT